MLSPASRRFYPETDERWNRSSWGTQEDSTHFDHMRMISDRDDLQKKMELEFRVAMLENEVRELVKVNNRQDELIRKLLDFSAVIPRATSFDFWLNDEDEYWESV